MFTFDVHVTPVNDQPIVTDFRIFLPPIAYNLSTNPNVGSLVKDLTTKPSSSQGQASPLTTDVDKDVLGIAVVQAPNSSLGSWYYQAPGSQTWLQIIVDNEDYTDSLNGQVEVFILNSDHKIRFQVHKEDILWTNVEALGLAKIVFLVWDGSDRRAVGRYNITRPSYASSAYSKRSAMAIVQRIGCDGRTGSEGKRDRCGICGGDGMSCLGCDGVLNSGATIGK